MRQSRRLGLNNGKKYWIFDGDNGGSKVGGWSGQRQTISSTQIKLNTIANSTSSARAYTNNTVNVTDYKKLVFIVTKSSGGTNGGYRRGGINASSNTSPSPYKTISDGISSATKITLDISAQTGNKYIVFWVAPQSGSSVSETIITKVWLE